MSSRGRANVVSCLSCLAALWSIGALTLDAQETEKRIAGSEDLEPEAVVRLALVIYIENYDFIPQVKNARSDAGSITTTLSRLGYKVTQVPDAEKDAIYDSVRALVEEAAKVPSILLMFFAGHGFQGPHSLYLVPKGAKVESIIDDSVPLSTMMYDLGRRPAGLSIFFIDACRTELPDNSVDPDIRSSSNQAIWTLDTSSRSILSFATANGFPARSEELNDDANSPYSTALSAILPQDEAMSLILEDLRNEVQSLSNERQFPGDYHQGNIANFFLNPTEKERDNELKAWRGALGSGTRRCISDFIDNYPDSLFLAQAIKSKRHLEISQSRNERQTCPQRF